MSLSRRRFLGTAAAAGASLMISGTLETLFARVAAGAEFAAEGYGPLLPDPNGLLDLPAGFTYASFSTAAFNATDDPRFTQRLTNGEFVPSQHDGMGCFPGVAGLTVLVRNHEVDLGQTPIVDERRSRPYDPLGRGGTTTLWVDSERRLVRAFPSLSGTLRNCAGGVTPWNSWLSCEECVYLPGAPDLLNHDLTPQVNQRHGYVFEVDASAEGLVEPVPIRAMGRFRHEAVAIDVFSGDVYLTEDREDGLLYRYRPDVIAHGKRRPSQLGAGDLAQGGTLEALRIVTRPSARTQNRGDGAPAVSVRERLRVDWIPIANVDPDMDMERDPSDPEPDPLKKRGRAAPTSLRARGFAAGAAQFARNEGIAIRNRVLYFCATGGGRAEIGQVWKLDLPAGELSLLVEPNDASLLDGPDNITVAPHGDLVICEDGAGENFIDGVTRHGRLYHLARNAHNQREFAGACFSADGQTMFVNLQEPGVTFAIRGPWEKHRG